MTAAAKEKSVPQKSDHAFHAAEGPLSVGGEAAVSTATVGSSVPTRRGRSARTRLVGRQNPSHSRTGWQAERRRRWAGGLDWPIAFWIAVLHLGALAAPFAFTWQGLGLMFVLGWLTGGIGICLGFHRLLTHRSFTTYRPLRWLIAWLGGLAGQGSAIHWVANHRKHHALSDEVGDPHSPVDGPWWSHMFWFMPLMSREDYAQYNLRWAPDLARDPVLRFLDRTFLLWHILLGALLFAAGDAWGGSRMAWSFLLWGMFVRLVYVLHSTWLVNSATHMWGYRNYETTDNSRNLWWVALLTYGEGWHNNHHALPRVASHGHRWWEFDVTYLTIRLMESLGLAWDVARLQRDVGGEATNR
jgi:stearoyl-CoA desaturase (delta-9 desaturase)